MKFLSYFTLIAAFAFGMNNTNAVAATPNTIDIEAISGGSVQASLNDATEIISLRMVASDKDRVMITLSDQSGQVVFKDKVIVGNRGTILEIPMTNLREGMYFLRVKGAELSYSDRFKKK